jgi:hypothetical protein
MPARALSLHDPGDFTPQNLLTEKSAKQTVEAMRQPPQSGATRGLIGGRREDRVKLPRIGPIRIPAFRQDADERDDHVFLGMFFEEHRTPTARSI